MRFHVKFLRVLLTLTLTCAAPPAFPAPQNHAEAVTALEDVAPERRAEAVLWIAAHGRMADQRLLLKRLRDEDEDVRGLAEQGLWSLWSRSGDAGVDRLLAGGVAHMQALRFKEAIAVFSEIIRRKPDFAEGWNKRATAYYLAGDFKRSLADCAQVMKRNPNHFGALSGYGQIYFQSGELEKAIKYWRRALQVNPNMPGVETSIEDAEQLLEEKLERSI